MHVMPKPVRVTAARARSDGLADLDRGYPTAARRADEALYARLGLLPEGTDLREVSGSVFGEQVAGYYDPTTKKLRIVEGTATANRVLDEIVLAHELTHGHGRGGQDVVVVHWRWDSRRDARVRASGAETGLAIATDEALAERLAGATLRG